MIKNNYLRTKTIENPNIADIKSVFIERPKASRKLWGTLTIR